MPIYEPGITLGLPLGYVTPQRIPECNGHPVEEVLASYGNPRGRNIKIGEGRPMVCGNLGDLTLTLVSHPRVMGVRADLYETCQPPGCANRTGRWAMFWHANGNEFGLFTTSITSNELILVARSLSLIIA
jgi:hypothetical protein